MSFVNLFYRYDIGWNLLWYTNDNVNFKFYSYPHFQTTSISESFPKYDYTSQTYYAAVFGGEISSGVVVVSNYLYGIYNKIYMKPILMTDASIVSSFISPITTSTYLWDYFISMFTDLGTMGASNSFSNLMYNYNSQMQILTNSISSPVDTTNGLSFSFGQTQTITSVLVTDEKAIGIQFWFKGSFIDGTELVALKKDSANKSTVFDVV